MDSAHSGRRAYWEAVSRKTDRANIGWLWYLASAKTGGRGWPIRAESGDATDEPSEDELIPYVSRDDLASHSSFPILDTNWNKSGNGQHGGLAAIPSSLRRTGTPPGASPPQRQRLPEPDDRQRDGKAFAGNHLTGALEVNFTVATSSKVIVLAERHLETSDEDISDGDIAPFGAA